MLEWLGGRDVNTHRDDPMKSLFKSGQETEHAEGVIEEYDDHPVHVAKWLRIEDGESEWVVKIEVPNGPDFRHSEMTYADQFSADAVFEKLKRDYDLSEWEPESDDD